VLLLKVNTRENRKLKLVVLTVVLCSILLCSAYALTYLWSAPITVAISTSSPYIKVFYSGNEVTSLDLGNLVPGSHVYITLYIKNTHPNAVFYLQCGSTLSTITTKITDSWFGGVIAIVPGQSRGYEYHIRIASDCPFATYSWTLYLYGPE